MTSRFFCALAAGVLAATTLTTAMSTATPVQAAPAPVPGGLIRVVHQAPGWRGMPDGTVVEYWTTGSHGELEPASGALFVPPGQAPASGWPIVALDHGTTGLGPGCGGQTTPKAEPATFFQRIAALGFAGVAPDYLGLGQFNTGTHPYLETRTEATATIDLVRAARAARSELSRSWAVIGGSQGGQAALATGYAAPHYAPELDFRGTVALDPESNTEDILPLAGPSFPDPSPSMMELHHPLVYITAVILAAVRAARPEANVDSYLTARGHTVLDRIAMLCEDDIVSRMDGMTFSDLLAKPLDDPHFRHILDDYMTVPISGYTKPILLLLNACDIVVPSPLHAALAAQLAANGVNYRSVIDRGKHTSMSTKMRKAMDDFVVQILRPAVG